MPRDAQGYPALPPLALAPLHRAFEAFARALRPARFHAVGLLAACLGTLAGGGAGAPQGARSALAPCLYALFDVTGPRELQQLHAALAGWNHARALARALHAEYESTQKYTGK